MQQQTSTLKFAFRDPQTGQIRWGMTLIVWAVVAVAIGFIVIKVRDMNKAQTANGANPYQGGGTNGNGTTNAGDTPATWVNQSHQDWVVQMKRVNEATYWACWGLNDPKERCEVWDNFTKLSDADQKAIAGLYKQSTGVLLRTAVEDISNSCVCYKLTDGNVKFRLLQNLYRLGI